MKRDISKSQWARAGRKRKWAVRWYAPDGSRPRHGGVYQIQVVSEVCERFDESAFSSPLFLSTSQWGDTVGAFVDGAWTPPDGTINVPSDVIAVLDKFSSNPSAPIKARCDVESATPDRLINITDVTRTLDGFSGAVYPFPPAEPCTKR